MSKRTLFVVTMVVVLVALLAAACGGSSSSSAPQTSSGDATAGAQAWATSPCQACHGAKAEGGQGPRLAGTADSFDRVKNTVRNGRGGEMPKFTTDQISDQTLADIYAWLQSM